MVSFDFPRSEANGRPLVTFFVVAYNQEDHVRAAIESAFAQTYRPLEILLSDDCSGDATFDVMQEMAAAYRGPHRVLTNRNPRNLGIPAHVDRIMELTEGAFVVQNAGDDVSAPDRTMRLVEAWQASGGRTLALHSAKSRIDGAGKPLPFRPDRHPVNRHTPLELLRSPPSVAGASMGWSRAVFEVFGPLGTTPMYEDYPICLRAASLGEVRYLDAPLVQYRVGGLSGYGQAYRAAEHALYGRRLKFLRWHLSFARRFLEDMDRHPPPDAEACRAQCVLNIARFSHEIALAEMAPSSRLRLLPKSLWLSMRRRDRAFAAQNLKYLFDRPYMAWLDRRHGVAS